MGHDRGGNASSWPVRFRDSPYFHLDTCLVAAYTRRVAIELPCQLANVEHTTGEAQRSYSDSRTPGLGSHFDLSGLPFLFSTHFFAHICWAACCHM
jgi:hypothetical protein